MYFSLYLLTFFPTYLFTCLSASEKDSQVITVMTNCFACWFRNVKLGRSNLLTITEELRKVIFQNEFQELYLAFAPTSLFCVPCYFGSHSVCAYGLVETWASVTGLIKSTFSAATQNEKLHYVHHLLVSRYTL